MPSFVAARRRLPQLADLVTRPEVGSLLLVGAYRDNEISPSHPLMRTLTAIREAGAPVHGIVLAPLSLAEVGRLVADALHCEVERAEPLARRVHERTGGNPFFAIQFLMMLDDEKLVTRSHRARSVAPTLRAAPVGREYRLRSGRRRGTASPSSLADSPSRVGVSWPCPFCEILCRDRRMRSTTPDRMLLAWVTT